MSRNRFFHWIWALAWIAILFLVLSRFWEIERLLRVASQGIWYFILAGLLSEGLFLLNQAALYSSVTRLTHQPLPTRDLLLPVLAADFLEVAAPTPIGNLPGVALIVSQAERSGMSRTEAVLVNVIYFVLDYTAFLSVLLVGMLHLYVLHDLRSYELGAALFLSAWVGTGLLLIAFAMWQPATACVWIGRAASAARRWWIRFRHRPLTSDERIMSFTANLQASIELLRRGGWKLLPPLAHAFAIPGINLLTLYWIFLAFHSPVSLGVLIAGYAIGTLLTILSITPSGLGPVEGMMVFTYTSLGVLPETATLVTLVYRGLTFWLPLAAGFLAMRRLR